MLSHDKTLKFLLIKENLENNGKFGLVVKDVFSIFYKINLWAYLENDPSIQEMSKRGMKSFFETVLILFKKSKPEAVDKAEFYAYLFSSTWKMYACFIWSDSKSLNPLINLPRLKSELRSFIMRAVFEEY